MFIRRVVGLSMEPALAEGDLVVCSKKRHYNVNDIVVATVNGQQVIKRIYGKTENKVYLLGDNSSASTDSRQYGAVDKKLLQGRCNYLYRKPLTLRRLK